MCLVLLPVYDCFAAALVDNVSLLRPRIPCVKKYRKFVGCKEKHAEFSCTHVLMKVHKYAVKCLHNAVMERSKQHSLHWLHNMLHSPGSSEEEQHSCTLVSVNTPLVQEKSANVDKLSMYRHFCTERDHNALARQKF